MTSFTAAVQALREAARGDAVTVHYDTTPITDDTSQQVPGPKPYGRTDPEWPPHDPVVFGGERYFEKRD